MGCDSVVISNLTLLNNISFTQNLIICSETSVMVGNNAYTTSGTYMDTFVTTNGCDSIVNTTITIAPAFLVTIGNNGSILLANPSSLPNYLWSNGDTTTTISPTTNGLYWVVAINSNGCISDTAFFEVEFITTSITDELISENKVLLRITNVIGQSIPHRKNTHLFYIYDDGTVEKKIFIE